MNSRSLLIAAGVSVAAIGACKNVAPEADQPAVIVNADDASRAALQATVNVALGKDVALADDSLTETSVLIIERKIPQSMDGSPAGGRTMESPIQFRLFTDGKNCVLVDQRNGERRLLTDTVCKAE